MRTSRHSCSKTNFVSETKSNHMSTMKSAALIILGLALFGTNLTTANPQQLPQCKNPDPAAGIYDPTCADLQPYGNFYCNFQTRRCEQSKYSGQQKMSKKITIKTFHLLNSQIVGMPFEKGHPWIYPKFEIHEFHLTHRLHVHK